VGLANGWEWREQFQIRRSEKRLKSGEKRKNGEGARYPSLSVEGQGIVDVNFRKEVQESKLYTYWLVNWDASRGVGGRGVFLKRRKIPKEVPALESTGGASEEIADRAASSEKERAKM